jgi:hypothetical protein
MKRKLCKHKKHSWLSRIIFYSTEGNTNPGCIYNDECNMGDESSAPDGVNYRCNPPESTREGVRNVRCNLAVNC